MSENLELKCELKKIFVPLYCVAILSFIDLFPEQHYDPIDFPRLL